MHSDKFQRTVTNATLARFLLGGDDVRGDNAECETWGQTPNSPCFEKWRGCPFAFFIFRALIQTI
jgi:hypothetical protein